MRYRMSIASMMAVILIMALCMVALRINSVLWGGMVLLTTLAVLCGAIFMSFVGSGPSRLAWIGCAVFGWPCFILGFGPMANDHIGPPRMTEMFEEVIPYINPELDSKLKTFIFPGRKGYSESLAGNVLTYVPSLQRYRQSSLSILTLGFAALGAILGRSHAVGRSPAAEPG